MSILVNVVNQKMHITSHLDDIVAGSQNFVKFRFNLSEDWDDLVVFAQFRQNGVAYNQFLNEENIACMPPEIQAGTCTLMLYGSHDTTIGTTNYLTLKITDNILVSDATSTDISKSLYDQLVAKIDALTSWSGQSVADLESKVLDLQENMPPLVEIDDTLSTAGKAADAAAVGDALKNAPFASVYYHTKREGLDTTYGELKYADVIGLYDALVDQYKTVDKETGEDIYNRIKPIDITSSDGSFTNRVYEISVGDYGDYGADVLLYEFQFGEDKHIKKPKYLIMSGIHGTERQAVFSTYRFIRDVLTVHNIPQAFREGAIIQVMPIANPLGFDAPVPVYGKPNGTTNGKDINHTFEWGKDHLTSEPETEVITQWLTDNSDACAFIDHHNNGMTNEIVMVASPVAEDSDRVKRVALRGVDRIIPYWRDVIKTWYQSVSAPPIDEDTTDLTQVVDRINVDVTFSYSTSRNGNGWAICYAQHVLGIPSIVIETSTVRGDFDNFLAFKKDHKQFESSNPEIVYEAIAGGAEAIGNILIELYSEANEVMDMTGVNDKLNTLIGSVNRSLSFRVESGFIDIPTDMEPVGSKGTEDTVFNSNVLRTKTSIRINIPCSNGAKAVELHADSATLETIMACRDQSKTYFASYIGNFFAPDAGLLSDPGYDSANKKYYHVEKSNSYQTILAYNSTMAAYGADMNDGFLLQGLTNCTNLPLGNEGGGYANTQGVIVPSPAIKAGRYIWTAYYWDELPEWQGGTF